MRLVSHSVDVVFCSKLNRIPGLAFFVERSTALMMSSSVT